MRVDNAVVAEKLRQLEVACHERGLPVTVQRRVIFEALVRSPFHPTVDEIYQEVRKRLPNVSRATVYRVLDTLVDLGLAKRIATRDSAARFDANLERHHHLVCESCGRVQDIPEESLPLKDLAAVEELTGFHIQDFSVEIRGICQNCRKKVAASADHLEHS